MPPSLRLTGMHQAICIISDWVAFVRCPPVSSQIKTKGHSEMLPVSNGTGKHLWPFPISGFIKQFV